MINLLIGRSDACPFAGVSRILIIAAHPDDAEYACGGFILRAIEWGARVDYVIVTDGQKGADEHVDGAAFGHMRRAEQLEAASDLGVNDVRFLGMADGEQQPTLELRELLVREIRHTAADLIVTHDPFSRRYRQHADHRAAGMSAIDAAYPAARLPTYYPEQIAQGLRTTHVRHALLFASDQPDCLVEMDEGMFARKVQALNRHASQRDSFGGGVASRLRLRATERVQGTAFAMAEPFKYADLD